MDPRIRTALFDAAGTLIYLPRTVGDHYREVALRFAVDLPAEALNRAFLTAWKSAPQRESMAGPRPDDDKGWWRTLVWQVIKDTASAGQWRSLPFDAYFETLYAHFAGPGVWAAYPEVVEVLTLLKSRGLKLGVVSNFDRRLYAVLDHLDLTRFFTGIVISSEVGADKPDPAVFRHALAALDAQPAETVHVGDDPKRDWGASVVGVQVFELQRPGNSLRDLIPWLETSLPRQNRLASPVEMP